MRRLDPEPESEDAIPRWLARLSRVVVVAFVLAVAALVVFSVVVFALR